MLKFNINIYCTYTFKKCIQYKKVITIVFLSLKHGYERSLTMTYNIIDIVDKDLTDTKLKEIVNKKLYKIIELLEFNVNYSE